LGPPKLHQEAVATKGTNELCGLCAFLEKQASDTPILVARLLFMRNALAWIVRALRLRGVFSLQTSVGPHPEVQLSDASIVMTRDSQTFQKNLWRGTE